MNAIHLCYGQKKRKYLCISGKKAHTCHSLLSNNAPMIWTKTLSMRLTNWHQNELVILKKRSTEIPTYIQKNSFSEWTIKWINDEAPSSSFGKRASFSSGHFEAFLKIHKTLGTTIFCRLSKTHNMTDLVFQTSVQT